MEDDYNPNHRDLLPGRGRRLWKLVGIVIGFTIRLRKLSQSLRPRKLVKSHPRWIVESLLWTLDDETGSRMIYKVSDRITGLIYSMMVINHNFGTSKLDDIRREIQILKELDHPNLVKCFDMWETADRQIYLLLDSVDKRGDEILVRDESEFAHFARQLLLGLEYLHRQRVSQGDVRLSNIFIDSKSQLKLMCVGNTLTGVPILSESGIWDVWNLGLTLVKLYGRSFGSVKPVHVYRKGKNRQVVSVREVCTTGRSTLSPQLKPSHVHMWSFFRCCMMRDASLRWTPAQLLDHPFVKYHSTSLSGQKRGHSSAATSFSVSQGSNPHVLFEQVGEDGPNKKPSLHYDKAIHHTESRNDSFSVAGSPHDNLGYPYTPDISNELIEDICNLDEDPLDNSASSMLCESLAMYDIYTSDGFLCPQTWESDKKGYVKCTQFCSLFPEGFQFDKDKLVQLWIAEECIDSEEERMEDVADSYFQYLLDDDVIIPSKYDVLYEKKKYKVNVSKASHCVSGNGEYLRADEGNLDEVLCSNTARHLSFHCETFDSRIFDSLKDFKQLRTLLLLGDSGCRINQLPNSLFLGLKLLRTLDLSFTPVSELPSSIGNLESLRCLDVSGTPISQLPESVVRLHFLQTLRLIGCIGVHKLPKELGKLINLCHLDFDIVRQLDSMPKGIGSLIKLQTLHAFLVGKHSGCGVGELEKMNNITGSFCISRLENVLNLDEAERATLGKKKHLDKLELRWNNHRSENYSMESEILERLQPHFGLKELDIIFYCGSKLPSWISNRSFTDLAAITLFKCINCHILPSLGELPSLKVLTVVGMESVTDINSVFCRKHGTQNYSGFPSLEKLTLDSMLNMEKWTGLEDGDFLCLRRIAIRYCPKLSILPVLSHLRALIHLEISHCTELISLPDGGLPSSMESLIISDCPKIVEGSFNNGGQDRLNISHVKNIWIDMKEISLH